MHFTQASKVTTLSGFKIAWFVPLSKSKFVYLVSCVACSAFCFLSKSHEWCNNKILDYLCSWNRCHLSCDRYFKYNLLHSLNTLIWKFSNLKNLLVCLPPQWVISWVWRELGTKRECNAGSRGTGRGGGENSPWEFGWLQHRCRTTRKTVNNLTPFLAKASSMLMLRDREIVPPS